MPKILTDTAVKNAKPRDTRYRLSEIVCRIFCKKKDHGIMGVDKNP